jgi:segregation and condensation protein A
MAEQEAERMMMIKRGNVLREMTIIGEDAGEGTEIQSLTLFKMMKTFEKVMKKMNDRLNKPQHVVFRYNYTMEESREYMLGFAHREKQVSFEKIISVCENRIHAIFLFLSMLELVQQQYMRILTGEGRNNFIVEWNNERVEDTSIAFTLNGPVDPTLN